MSPVCSTKAGGLGQGVHEADGPFEGAGDVRIGGLVEADVTVAELHEKRCFDRGAGLGRLG